MATTATLPAGTQRGGSRERTRARLLAVGRRAFARKGHAGTNLKDDVLGPARVSVGSFYHQFKDKTDLLLAILEEHSETFRALVRDAHVRTDLTDPLEVARHSFSTVFGIAERNDDLFRIMVRERESDDPRVRAYLRANHRRWVESLAENYRRIGLTGVGGEGAVGLAAELVSAMTMGTVLGYLDLPARERGAARERLIDGLVRMTIGGLPALVAQGAPPPGQRRQPAPTSKEEG